MELSPFLKVWPIYCQFRLLTNTCTGTRPTRRSSSSFKTRLHRRYAEAVVNRSIEPLSTGVVTFHVLFTVQQYRKQPQIDVGIGIFAFPDSRQTREIVSSAVIASVHMKLLVAVSRNNTAKIGKLGNRCDDQTLTTLVFWCLS